MARIVVRTAFFIFYFSLCKIVDSKALKISIAAIIKNPEMLRFAPDHLKTKKIYKNGVKKLPFAIKYVPDLKKCVIKFLQKMVEC